MAGTKIMVALAGLGDRLIDNVEHGQAVLGGRAALAGRHAAHHLRAVLQALPGMESSAFPVIP